MELRQLEYFTVIAEELHFGHSALRLQMTQPPVMEDVLTERPLPLIVAEINLIN